MSRFRIAVMTPGAIAEHLAVPFAQVVEWMQSGELPFIEIEGERGVLSTAFERFEERYRHGVTIEEQAARYIGEGFEGEEHFDPLEGLDLGD